jgi:DNA-binding transcriptional ArsR family regulator
VDATYQPGPVLRQESALSQRPLAGQGQGAGNGPDEAIRAITNVETLKALADPIRLSLLSALMNDSAGELPVRSVKELAAELGEPQTKLYRHVKQLEAVGLIRVVSSRVVSGIIEQRYQACQSDFMFGPGLTDDEKGSTESEAAVAAVFEMYRSRFFAARRADRNSAAGTPATEPYRRQALSVAEARMPAAKAAAIRERLQQVIDELAGPPDSEDQDSVQVNVLIGYYTQD